jgi:tellurite resistance protein
MSVVDSNLLSKVAKSLAQPPVDAPTGTPGSILTVAAASYGSKPEDEDLTIPTGFDPRAAALFEAVVEAAYLVANADGEFDDDERRAFESVVLQACGANVEPRQVEALLQDLQELLAEDGVDARIDMIGRTVTKPPHQREVLRIAALLAQISGGVSDVERQVLSKISKAFAGTDAAVDEALREAEKALAS